MGKKVCSCTHLSIFQGINDKKNTFEISVNDFNIKHTKYKIQFKMFLKATLI